MRKLFPLGLVLLIYSNFTYAEQSLMRLFYTPAERAEIDAGLKAEQQTDKGDTAKSLQPRTEKIIVKGYLKRKGQPDVVWVNDANTLKSKKLLPDIKVVKVNQNNVSVKVRDKGLVKMKPGQVLLREVGQVQEVYEAEQ